MAFDNKALVLRHHDEIWSKGNLEAVDEIYAADFIGHHPGTLDWIGTNSVKLAVSRTRQAFPDFREIVEDVVIEGAKVVTRFTASGTHLGMLGGLSPTGKQITMAEIGIFRIANGKIVEKWGQLDRLGMFQQLGILPPAWPPLEFLYEIVMDAEVHDLGQTPGGPRRVVHVTGGTFEGPRLRGTVLPGGGDWLVGRADGSRRLDVRITLRTDDGALIYAHYPGVFHAPPDVLERIQSGANVDVTEYYFRVAPMFETGSPKYDWLNRIVATGIGRRTRTQVGYSVYAIL
ncbi:MAG: DUF3237 family protein [Candidatus Rokubacteria bacterium]|nr:DUF3237 family protein [Candidatus Rokubacteria bacterium]